MLRLVISSKASEDLRVCDISYLISKTNVPRPLVTTSGVVVLYSTAANYCLKLLSKSSRFILEHDIVITSVCLRPYVSYTYYIMIHL